jgi:acyl transferase domain-containing protein
LHSQGPCVSTDTACSSSLVAANLAAQGLAAAAGSGTGGGSGGSAGGAALAGGVNVMLLSQTTARICLLQVHTVQHDRTSLFQWIHNM